MARQLGGLRVSVRVEPLPHGEEIHEGTARVASEMRAALVVLASGTGLVLGTFAQGVLELSPCPVTIVHYPLHGRSQGMSPIGADPR